MDRLFKRILFFILMPIFGTLGLFIHLTYPWWQGLSKANFFKKILFILLAPIYAPIAFFLFVTYEWWAELAK